jgi:hypothetical protein
MNKKKTLQFLQSFVAIPLFATSMQMSGVVALPSSTVVIDQFKSVIEVSAITPQEMEIRKKNTENAKKIDAYFAKNKLPLAGYGEKFVEEAIKNDLDPFLLASIGMIESTGGKFACGNNFFGWASCKVKFESPDKAIETVSFHLGGNHPKTSKYYEDKDVKGILVKYNSVDKRYYSKVTGVMKAMENMEIEKSIEIASNEEIK